LTESRSTRAVGNKRGICQRREDDDDNGDDVGNGDHDEDNDGDVGENNEVTIRHYSERNI